MAKFRKKPVIIEAMHYTGSKHSFDRLWKWMGGEHGTNLGYSGTENDPQEFDVQTLEGKTVASPGDWIIKGVVGEFYPCKPNIFEATYEAVESED